MPTPNSKTNLIFKSRKFDMQLRLVVHGSNIEIYQLNDDTGLEAFKCLLDRHTPYDVFLEACIQIKRVVKNSPLGTRSFDWLQALNHHGMLEDQI